MTRFHKPGQAAHGQALRQGHALFVHGWRTNGSSDRVSSDRRNRFVQQTDELLDLALIRQLEFGSPFCRRRNPRLASRTAYAIAVIVVRLCAFDPAVLT